MALLYSLRLRRTLTSLSTLHRSLPSISTSTSTSTPLLRGPTSSAATATATSSSNLLAKLQPFRSSAIALYSSRSTYNPNSNEEIGPDTILFEGCDYNHWLIVMDFGKENRLSPEEMVRAYEETCAKGLNISVEEAKTKIYACSTTTYVGFQVLMTEEESKKFEALPGVTFVLPDSYIDPANKEYGGDKYINGTIIPRPPPVQYGRQGRPRDRRNNQTTYNQSRPSFDYQAGDGRNRGAPQNYSPQQNYGPPGQAPQQNYGPPGQAPQQNYGPPGQAPRQNYGPPGQGERRDPMPMNNMNYAPGGMGSHQSGRGDPMPSQHSNYNQGQGNYHPQERRDFPQGNQSAYVPPAKENFMGENRNYGPPQGGPYGQGAGGYQGQGTDGAYKQGASSGYGQSYPGPGEGQRFSQGEQRNWQGEQRTYAPMGQTGSDQGRY
nr:multiple organellar RNA editing factor 1, mitochondrial isoform X2 [Quercus suber]